MIFLTATAAQGQITIGGSVYGGGNAGDVGGNTAVTVRAGDLNKVFGGARMADVGGNALVNIDGENMSDDIIINYVYGGNDISGAVGTSNTLPVAGMGKEMTAIGIAAADTATYSSFVLTSAERKETTTTDEVTQPHAIFIGQLFGGGNGDYIYPDTLNADGKYFVLEANNDTAATNTDSLTKPVLGKAFLNIRGGTIAYVYGGGNNATVTGATDICINNKSKVTTCIPMTASATDHSDNLLLKDNAKRLKDMDILMLEGDILSEEFQFSRVFGGNNKAPMAIQPTWHLKDGKIRNLYSGGNEGMMTNPNGLLLEIAEGSTIKADNVYGGCRKADVMPLDTIGNLITEVPNLPGYRFPKGFSARILIRDGDINNVYGGNDISGKVFGGNAVGVYTSIRGDIYGGGNGSYPYTDNAGLASSLQYGDYYYDRDTMSSVEALNAFRPHAEQVSIRVKGTKGKPTVIGGSIYCGGNSATIMTDKTNPTVELKIGSYVIADNVFLGNNGANMVTEDVLSKIAGSVTLNDTSFDFSQMNLRDSVQFATYMESCAMDLIPSVVFDKDSTEGEHYEPYSTKIGSFYCGGNVGSMTYAGTNTMDFSVPVYIYNKVVGGCNNAIIDTTAYNARYEGGILGMKQGEVDERTLDGDGHSFTDTDGNIRNRLVMNFGTSIIVNSEEGEESTKKESGVQFRPLRWNNDRSELVWNTIDSRTGAQVDAPTDIPEANEDGSSYSTDDDFYRRLDGGHIYGGCYESGIVNGNVVINLNASTVNREELFDIVEEDSEGEASLYGESQLTQDSLKYNIKERNTGVILDRQGMDVLGTALNVFGGGKGKDTEIWGSTTINLKRGYTFQVFGGSEEGVIGRSVSAGGTYTFGDGTTLGNGKSYKYDPKYSCTINLCGDYTGVSKQADHSEDMAEAEFIYGGGFFGPICGNTIINLGKGRVFNTFAGSCMADILGHTETYIGRQVNPETGAVSEGFPFVRDMVYGGNDLGGRILGETGTDSNAKADCNFSSRVRTTEDDDYDAIGKVHNTALLTASSYIEYTQGRANAIFGGCYGTYDYKNSHYGKYFYATEADDIDSHVAGEARSGYTKPRMGNAFVNFRPTLTKELQNNKNNRIGYIYGAGQGYPGDGDRDIMQRSSYILIDIPDSFDAKNSDHYRHMEVFGGGAWSGVGMERKTIAGADMEPNDFNALADTVKDKYSAIIDLARGQIGAAYGGSLLEGVVRRTVVNVPAGSTVKAGSIFGGAYGTDILAVCDVIEAHVEYHSEDARLIWNPIRMEKETDSNGKDTIVSKGDSPLMKGAIYGSNNDQRRTIYAKVNIDVPVRQENDNYGLTTATVYGAGYGVNTWAEYTEINLAEGAEVYEVYGGGQEGRVLNGETVQKYMETGQTLQGATDSQWQAAWKLGGGYDPLSSYAANPLTNLDNSTLVRRAEMDNRSTKTWKYNTNVIINKSAHVVNYAYGGGLGVDGTANSGDIWGTTYIALLGGAVQKDIYAAGTNGGVLDNIGAGFTASANAFIAGGTVRNVYGGGWKGDVGYTSMTYAKEGWSNTETSTERPGETHVVIGIRPDQPDNSLKAEIAKVKGTSVDSVSTSDFGFLCGNPAIQRNAYGGGEGGAVFGTANLVLNNGHIGYVYLDAGQAQDEKGNIVDTGESATERYEEKINDETYYVNQKWAGAGRLKDCGNLFGGGYDVRSCVDTTKIVIWNGTVRNSVHGGGEIATIGRGSTEEDGASRTLKAIYKPGMTSITMYNGQVLRNVFGGGKGYNLFGYGESNTLYTDGYVFGQTEVQIHGGKIGTKDGVAEGYGNVFGGGDIGYVYSKGYFNSKSRKEETGSPGHTYYYYNDGDGDKLSEDCKVVISPWLQVMTAGTIDGKYYNQFDYVDTDVLNRLPKKVEVTDSEGKNVKLFRGDWLKLYTGANVDVENATIDTLERGITIHNAVFGGGNVSSNSDQTYANATTIFGNTTATLYDVYHRDFITVGTEHIGGLYGGGNLSLVDGYRELNITNYGTDYYGLESQITLDEYRSLSSRERAYFQLQYVCTSEITLGGTTYKTTDDPIREEDYLKLVETYGQTAKNAFTPYGFCSIYAGRLLNTIQRADMCGVYGSRMVLQGAKDRVADVGEKIDYTINRVGEVSLNLQRSLLTTDAGYTGDTKNLDTDEEDAVHGNYFGIYSNVNYMGNLTSDVRFGDKLELDKAGTHSYYYTKEDGSIEFVDEASYKSPDKYTDAEKAQMKPETYYSWKAHRAAKNNRNKGKSLNQVALASGVFLELTTENSTADKKDYGYITGVVELDLINVKQDQVGGGFVYAKNEHRVPRYYPDKRNVILSEYNHTKKVNGIEIRDEAHTYKRYRFSEDQEGDWSSESTSYIISGADTWGNTETWETSGNFIHPSKRIVDDCYPTNNAYIIGSANYSDAHYWYVKGEVYIYDQKVSAYTGSATAYQKEVHLPLTITAASHGKLQLLNVKPNLYAYYVTDTLGNKVRIGSVNDKQGKLIDKVWVNNDNDGYGLNEVITWWDWHKMSASDRAFFVTETFVNTSACIIDDVEYAQGTYVLDAADLKKFKEEEHTVTNLDGETLTDLEDLFRSSNNIGHDTGYALTLDMDTPGKWSGGNPTFTPLESGVYGQRQIEVGDIVTKKAVENNTVGTGDQAVVEKAYVATVQTSYTYGGTSKTVNAGTAIPESEYTAIGSPAETFKPAFVSTQTVKLAENSYLLYGDLRTADEITAMMEGKTEAQQKEISAALTEAYICSTAGGFGGQQLYDNEKYSPVDTWCALPASDRIDEDGNYKFSYNYDALDLLASPDYLAGTSEGHGEIYENPATYVTKNAIDGPDSTRYTDKVDVEYNAVFHATADKTSVTYSGGTVTDGGQLTNSQYETVRNDQRHYTRVSVAAGGETVYFAKDNFIYNGTPYSKGQVVTTDVATKNTSAVEAVQMDNSSDKAVIRYYCYEDYETHLKGEVIEETAYSNLTNDQQYFVIQGKEPTETTTLYVSSESDAKDVLSERVYTVVYQYTYYENEDEGNIKLSNELHVINIHIELESGAPTIGTLYAPATVLPGHAVGLTRPEVQPGLYEVLTSGWEIFDNLQDATRHRNGTPFTNNGTPVYWYQNQKGYVSFYSKTYLGKAYSNPVPLSVANYHDLDAVMKDSLHHLYVDHPDVDRACKIYIDNRVCQSDETKSELDLLKDFYDLSVLDISTFNTDEQGRITTVKPTGDETPADSPFKGHAPLGSHIAGGSNLEFFLRSNIAPRKYTTWTPIAGEKDSNGNYTSCFSGNLHGDGYFVSGLTGSLFGSLCGNVYNLGVVGSFTGSGVADAGSGRVENCWIKSTATPAEKTAAVFGGTKLVNSYYCTNGIDDPYLPGDATPMSPREFYNGTVAYNLNGFYLKKRFYDNSTSWTGTKISYNYLQPDAAGALPEAMSEGWYPDSYAVYQPDVEVEENETLPNLGYVENRFYDGDFRYAAGSIPENTDTRMRIVGEDNEAKTYFTPIWPDDYIFFGQSLNYGHMESRTHQEVPSHIVKNGNFTQTNASGNRVYRAPAYFRSSKMGMVHFNPAAVFAQSKNGDAATEAYKGMTAIDFSGYNDANYAEGTDEDGHFFTPLLDDGGLTGFQNIDLTKNLLVYTKTGSAAADATDGVVGTYLTDQKYAETHDAYRTVAAWDRYSDNIRGHWVQMQGNSYVAPYDHMLVDMQDFNAPIAYKMGSGRRMWYQPFSVNYADLMRGWNAFSLPFTSEIVTTDTKGEITHFYEGSAAGHEYWLRELDEIEEKEDEEGVYTADFKAPAKGDGTKTYTNTFLWDYYYSHDDASNSQEDMDVNEDRYQKDYYKSEHDYTDYPFMAAGTPYLVGFPGSRYYEFDLSGNWTPQNRHEHEEIRNPGQQTITFASEKGARIAVSDEELSLQTISSGGFSFVPNYLNSPVDVGKEVFLLNTDGDRFVKETVTSDTVMNPFRPYFVTLPGAALSRETRSIVFGQGADPIVIPQEENPDENGTLAIGARRSQIVVSSSLKYRTAVRIYNSTGVAVADFIIAPGETVETTIPVSGAYFVRTADGRYLKKLAVK